MCVLCERANQKRFQAGGSADSRVFQDLSIAPAELIDDFAVAATRQFTATDGVLDFYLHTPGGPVTVAGGGFGQQVIQSVPISAEDQEFFRWVVQRLDAIIDLDFRESATAAGADVDLFYDTEIDLGEPGTETTLGLATTSGFGGWELFVNQPEVAFDTNYRRYVLIHEFGHALGLEHPFEASDGDVVNGTTDPWNSSFPEETVMAYRDPAAGVWPEFFTNNDLNALAQIWGAEQAPWAALTGVALQPLGPADDVFQAMQVSAFINGNAGADVLTGSSEEDVFRGGIGADVLTGRAGDDRLFGDDGDDLIRGGQGADVLNGGRGDDQLFGDRGADIFRVSAGADVIAGFSVGEGDRLELSSDLSYRLVQGSEGMEIVTADGVTTLLGVNLASFDSTLIDLV